jgi:16S rRNA (guanine527-N7)-methyltransferase
LQLEQIATYVEVLLRWNKRMNLTAVREPENIVTRHFGESLFLARHVELRPSWKVVDLGSGAGFPGLPMKIYVPEISLTLIESHKKKAIFLREIIRTLELADADVFAGRAEDLNPTGDSSLPAGIGVSNPQASGAGLQSPQSKLAGFPPRLVTLRAVEHFEDALRTAARLARSGTEVSAQLALLVGRAQAPSVPGLTTEFVWDASIPVPLSTERVLLVGTLGS